ncbi:hypothetical protein HAX54_001073 [Datura stramonium]|uniref:Uncharacterized protein n=1 Tax=Datura stramonium TaxID=4076 RepID=A0ABS8T440_DATST|nr:hypothetical protein [Datura stramonium]
MPSIDTYPFKDLILRPPYREIRHTLSGPNLVVKPWYDSKGLDVMKMEELKGIHSPVLSISERNTRINNILSHLVAPGFEEPFGDADATDEEQDRLDSDLESDDDGDDSEMGEATYAPTDDEDLA